jgi:uncharacterized lipoprotein YddW (UPF0748 family)
MNQLRVVRFLLMSICAMLLVLGNVTPIVAQTTAQTKPQPSLATPKLFPKSTLFKSKKPAAKKRPPIAQKVLVPTTDPVLPGMDGLLNETPAPPPNPYPPLPKQEVRGVWLTNNDMTMLKDRTKLGQAMTQLGQLNFNTVYPVVWNSGYVTYPSVVAQQMGIQPFVYRGDAGQDILADVTAQAHARGMLVVPWFEFGFMAPSTSELATLHPEWLTQQRNGDRTSVGDSGEVVWLNPFHPEAQKFITDLVVEIVSQYDVDGIQFDDHMSLPNQFGYDPYTLARYAEETQSTAPNNPKDEAWTRWRADKITDFMAQLRIAIKQRKPKAILSVSPNYADFAYKMHLQDWRTWVDRGLVDELVVQVYSSNLNQFVNTISRSEMVTANQTISTGVGIMTGQRRKPVGINQIQNQVQAAHDRGLGTAFFYYESLWNDAPEPMRDRLAGFQAMFRNPAPRR